MNPFRIWLSLFVLLAATITFAADVTIEKATGGKDSITTDGKWSIDQNNGETFNTIEIQYKSANGKWISIAPDNIKSTNGTWDVSIKNLTKGTYDVKVIIVYTQNGIQKKKESTSKSVTVTGGGGKEDPEDPPLPPCPPPPPCPPIPPGLKQNS